MRIRSKLWARLGALVTVFALGALTHADVVPVTGVTGHDGGNWPNYYGHLSDMVNGSDASVINTGAGADLTNPGMTVVDPINPGTWRYAGNSWHQEWKANSRLSGASNGKIGWAILDLGAVTADLENMYLWNVRSQNNTENVATYNVYYATSPSAALPTMPNSKQTRGDYDFSSGGWTLLNGAALSLPQNGANNNTPQGLVTLGGMSARYIGIEILTAGGSANRVGLAQVEITKAADEPEPEGCTLPSGAIGLLDLNANGGINPATGRRWQAGDTYRYAFTSSQLHDALSSDINTYNNFVQSLADASTVNVGNGGIGAANGVTWKAIGSTPTVDARENTETQIAVDGTGGPIYLLDGTTILAPDYPTFWTFRGFIGRLNKTELLTTPVTVDIPPAGGRHYGDVWTGTQARSYPDSRYGTGLDTWELGSANNRTMGGLWGGWDLHWIQRWGYDHVLEGAPLKLPIYGMSSVLEVCFPEDLKRPPVAICQDIAITVSACDECVTIQASDLDNGSYDDPGDTLTFTVNGSSSFELCGAVVGGTTVTLTVTDQDGLEDTCEATVTLVHQDAPVWSVDFNTLNENDIQSGDAAHTDGLTLPGQVGEWYPLTHRRGSGFSDTVSAVTPGGTFTFNTTGENFRWDRTADRILRNDYAFLSGSSYDDWGPVKWTISGLEAGASYNLVCYSPIGYYRGNLYLASDFAIEGHDAGNGEGNPASRDLDGDGNFVGVAACDGTITGWWIAPIRIWNTPNARFGGIQWQKDICGPNRCNEPPECPDESSIAAQCDGVLLDATATDPDGDALTYTWTVECDAILSPGDDGPVQTLTFGDHCTHECEVSVLVEDGRGGQCLASFEVSVTPLPPVLVGVPANTVVECGDPIPGANVIAVDGCYTGSLLPEGELGILDMTANEGINPATGAPWQDGDTYRLVFVTSVRRDALSDNMADYDDFVQNVADAASLGGTWKAIGSTVGVNSRARVGMSAAGGGAVLRLDSVTVANNYAGFWDGGLDSPIEVDENGNVASGNRHVWGGCFANGNPESTRHLGSVIIDGKGGFRAHRGEAFRTNGGWIRNFHDLTSAAKRFYAISDPLTISAPPQLNLVSEESSEPGKCPSVEVITRTWSATSCGLTTTGSQQIIVEDTTAPVIASAPPSVVVECAEAAPAPAVLAYTDNCDANGTVAAESTGLVGGPCGGTITYTWNISDGCGNAAETQTQVITVDDTVPPVLVGVPGNLTVECSDPIPGHNVTAIDECAGGALLPPLGILDLEANGGINPATGVAWAAGDTYRLAFVTGPTAQATSPDINDYHTFVQNVAGGAGLGGAIWRCIGRSWNDPDRRANSGTSGSGGSPIFLVDGITKIADDNDDLWNGLDNLFNVTETGSTYSGAVASGSSRRFGDPNQSKIEHGRNTFTDGRWWQQFNGQQASQWHFYAISEPLAIIGSGPGSVESILVEVDESFVPGCGATGVLTRRFYAEDECGNDIRDEQMITIVDTTNPTASNPASVEVECRDEVPAADVEVVTDEADNCGTPQVLFAGDASDGKTCPETITRTYRVVDSCGNAIEVTQIITVNDVTDPVISLNAPAMVEIDCSTQPDPGSGATGSGAGSIDSGSGGIVCQDALPTVMPPIPAVTATDNCVDPTIERLDDMDTETCPGTIVRTWVATDDCGNSARVVQMVTLRKACVQTAEYWKCNPGAWLTPMGPVEELDLDGTPYDAADARAILCMKSKGDATVVLAQQLIAALLNQAQGADDSCGAMLIDNARAFLSVTAISSDPSKDLKKAAKDLAKALQAFNEGYCCAPACLPEEGSGSGACAPCASGSGGGGDPDPDPDLPFTCNGVPKPCPCGNGQGGDFWVLADGSEQCAPPQ